MYVFYFEIILALVLNPSSLNCLPSLVPAPHARRAELPPPSFASFASFAGVSPDPAPLPASPAGLLVAPAV